MTRSFDGPIQRGGGSTDKAASVEYLKNFIAMVDKPLPEMRDYFEQEITYLADLARDVGPTATVMDVGCGIGRVMLRLGTLPVQNMVGVESDEGMLKEAKKRLDKVHANFEFRKEDIFYTTGKRDFDLVFESYNMPGSDEIDPEERVRLLRKMVEHTRPGGDTVASFWKPTDEKWLRKYYEAAGAQVKKIEGNVIETTAGTFTRFTDDEIRRMADEVGVPYKIIHLRVGPAKMQMFDLVHFSERFRTEKPGP